MAASAPATYEDLRIDTRSLASALWRRKWRIILLSAFLAVAAWMYLSMLTPLYESSASILVEGRSAGEGLGAGADAAAVQSQAQLVQSRETLLKVIDDEDLRDVPELNRAPLGFVGQILALFGRAVSGDGGFTSDDALISELRDRMVVARERDSRVISIAFRAEDPALAARVANGLARAHVERRAELVTSDATGASAFLDREIAALRERVTQAEAAVVNYRIEHDLFAGADNASLLEQQMSQLIAQISAATERQSMVATQARLIRGLLEAGQPVETIAEVRASPVVQQLAEQKASLQAQRAERAATRLASHPDVRALDAQIAELTAQIQAEGRRIAQAFESQASLEADLAQSLRDELTRLKIQASTAEVDGVALAELERNAAAERDLLNAFLARYREVTALSNGDAALPDVRIVSTASEPSAPVHPQQSLLVAAVFMVAAMLQIGAVVLGELAGGAVFVPREAAAARRVREVAPADEEPMFAAREPEPVYWSEPAPSPEPAPQPEPAPALAEVPGNRVKKRWTFWRKAQVSQEDQGIADRTLPGDEDYSRPEVTDLPPVEPRHWPEIARAAEEEDEPADLREGRLGPPASGPIAALAALAAGAPAERAPRRVAAPVERMAELLAEPADEPVPAEEAPAAESLAAAEEYAPPDEHFVDAIENAPPALAEADTELSLEEARDPRSEDEFDIAWDEASQTAMLAAAPAPVSTPEDVAPAFAPTPEPRTQFGQSVPHIAMHIAANNVRLAMVASAEPVRADREAAGKIALELLALGHSVCIVDAGGRGEEAEGAGLTDLTSGLADFGEVVHRIDSENLYHVPWGRQLRLDFNSPRIPTLIEALGEIHDHVLILTGPMERPSVLTVFAGPDSSLIIAGGAETTVEQIARLSNEARAFGYGHVSLARSEDAASEVA